MSTSSTSTSSTANPVRQKLSRTFAAIGIGNALEWYDWTIYATFAPFLASQLFSGIDPFSAILATLAIFAVGFLARPFGGFLFGWISDRHGRKFSMMLSIALAALGSLVIGVAPTYAAVGVIASTLLLLARLVQGLAHGGELPSAQTYLSELAPAPKRGLWSSFIYASGSTGILVGTLLGAILSSSLAAGAMSAWGWRVPFLLGGVLGLFALYMRTRMPESEIFVDHTKQTKRARIWPQIRTHRAAAARVIGLTVGFTVAFYSWSIAAPQFAITAHHADKGQAFWAGVVANLVFIGVLPLWGKLSDRIGRRPVLLIGSLGGAVLMFPMNALLSSSVVKLGIAMSVMLIFVGAIASVAPATYAELFPTDIRTVGVGIPYSICVAIFGGTAPYLQTFLNATAGPSAFSVYTILLLLISAAVILGLRETKGLDLRTAHSDPVT